MSPGIIMSPEHYQRIMENLTHAVMMFDADLELDYINPAGEMLFGVSAKRLIGQKSKTLFPAGSRLLEAISRGVDSGHSFTEHEAIITLPGQREVTVDYTISPLAKQLGQSGLLVEIQQMDRQIHNAREEHQLSQQQTFRTLVRGLAHEIKNPLGGLRGAAQLLERELPSDDLKEFTNIIIGEADRLQNLVDRILGPNTYIRQLVSIGISSGIHIITDYDPSIPDLIADRDQLIQAILNIVGNAVQALGNKGEITLSTRSVRQFTIGHVQHKLVCKIDVIDNGPGIPDDMLESIFLPMVTGRAEGTGLGLSISQSLINQHGGLIQCESQPGRTKFSLFIPFEGTPSESVPLDTTASETTNNQTQKTTTRVNT
jgi:two-component system nitrogen regulation sensor histidine kinase GlnL